MEEKIGYTYIYIASNNILFLNMCQTFAYNKRRFTECITVIILKQLTNQ